ncbi:hypothetical protein [Blastococcus tunisiensis]|uniref:hypothetical protein n=1 Tax=Blastococcus tunisiensis TaxID=1798228 RepID=UPI0020C8D8B0|nr:hypothetical protein [Blastococcus sp. DSM 46838]
MGTRVAVGRDGVAGELRVAAPLMAGLRAPVTARAPWLTAVLNATAARPGGARPAAVVVGPPRPGPPDAAAFLALRRRGPRTLVTMLGDGVGPAPGGGPPARLLARDDGAAELLAEGVCAFLGSLRGPWRLQLAGLPLGDPTVRALAARLPDGLVANARSSGTADGLDGLGEVRRSRDPRDLERLLPGLLAREPDARRRDFLRAAARLHAAIGQVEVAVLGHGRTPRAGLLTLVDGPDRRPWTGWSDAGGLDAVRGAPVVSLTAPARGWP